MGSATFVVTGTGQSTQMGQIADMVDARRKRSRSPLQRELDGMTKVFGLLAWLAVAIIAIFGIARGQDIDTLVLLCISTAISAIPTGLPTFVQTMLVLGRPAARRVQGGREVAHRRRDARRHDGHQQRQDRHADDERDDRDARCSPAATGSRSRAAATRRPARSSASPAAQLPDFRRLALGLALCSDATVGRRRVGHRRPDRGGARGARGEDGRRRRADARARFPRRAEVPFDSEYKFMATFHDRPDWLRGGDAHRARTS